ncbi:DUF5050 domain-containing protein [Clostridium manihotivorum]|uniref:DUF5050 domain-containing protein n=1 Tax=Clostridium manihotivorum TaxID=2320868 RepID=A0A3R5QRS6_9CLOT|nr:DUF5050 domain-containing protein [Clostridium manihotivorum]QAA30913.1 hypothetical protein C1I91_04110 [Clostridium manihotivorum]
MKRKESINEAETEKTKRKTILKNSKFLLVTALLLLVLAASILINLSKITTFYYIKRAEITVNSKNYDAAINYCDKILKTSDKDSKAIVLKAKALEGKNDIIGAIKLLNDSISKFKGEESLKLQLDDVINSLKFNQESINIYEGQSLVMPSKIKAHTSDNKEVELDVKWFAKPLSTDIAGTYILGGNLELINKPVECKLDIIKFTGNTEGNINNKSNMVRKDSSIYFVNGEDNNNIYKMNIDGTEKKKLTDIKNENNLITTFYNLRLIDDGLLGTKLTGYINSDYNTEVFRMDTNGAGYKVISQGKYSDILDVNNKKVFYKEYYPDSSTDKYFEYDIANDKSADIDHEYLKSRNLNTGEISITNPRDKMLAKYIQTTEKYEYSFMLNDKDINYNYFSNHSGELHKKDISTKEDKLIEKNILCANILNNKIYFSNNDGIYVIDEVSSSKKKLLDIKDATDINLCDGYLTYRDTSTNYIKLLDLKTK